jgi:hypothetical protein
LYSGGEAANADTMGPRTALMEDECPRHGGVAGIMERMNWNDAAEDLLNQVLAQTPRPVRDSTETQLRQTAEAMAEEDGKNRVGVETVIAAWVQNTPATLRSDLPRQMERFGLDPEEYRHLLD